MKTEPEIKAEIQDVSEDLRSQDNLVEDAMRTKDYAFLPALHLGVIRLGERLEVLKWVLEGDD